jgi:HEAT repeat protein
MQTVAVGLVREVGDGEMVEAVSAELSNLPAIVQVQLLSALADVGNKAALDRVVAATKSSDEMVSVAALNALGQLGDASSVDMLVSVAAEGSGAKQEAARQSLYRLVGEDVDKMIVDKVGSASGAEKVELIKSIDQRNITAGTAALLKATEDENRQVRVEAIKALRTVAQPSDMSTLISLMLKAPGSSEESEFERTIVAVSRKVPEGQSQCEAVLAALSTASDMAAKGKLMSLLGKIGDEKALPVLRAALDDSDEKVQDAAVRGLSNWPSAAPGDDLLEVAKNSPNQVHRVLALRGYVRLIGLESDRDDDATIAMYQKAMDIAPNANEKRMVLSGLANVRTYEALQMAKSYLDDPELTTEAQAAVVKIAPVQMREHGPEVRELLEKIMNETKSESIKSDIQRMLERRRR